MIFRLTESEVNAINARNRPRAVRPLDEPKKVTIAKPKRAPKPVTESEVKGRCMLILEAHPAVAFWWRQNTGGAKYGNRYVKFGFKGASDLMFVLAKSGRFGACECKRPGEEPDDDQMNFLANVNDAGGLGMWTDDPAKLLAELDALK